MRKEFNCVVIDDESDSREIVGFYLNKLFPQLNVVAEGFSVESGVKALENHKVDLLFLDIQLLDGTGFDILAKLKHINFSIIFITAFDQYAIEAIKHHALDYLLKPIEEETFKVAVNRFISSPQKINAQQINELSNRFNPQGLNQLSLPTLSGYKIVELDKVIKLMSDGNYTNVHLNDNTTILVSKKIKEFEKLLPADKFCRIHNSHIVNVAHVTEYIRGRGGQVVLKDGSTLNVSDNKKTDLLKFWE